MFHGLEVDARDDVFALSCIAYELLSGRHPYDRLPATLAQARRIVPTRPAEISNRQWEALQIGLQLDREKREITAGEMAARFAESNVLAVQGRRWTDPASIVTVAFCLIPLAIGLVAFAIPGVFRGPSEGHPPRTLDLDGGTDEFRMREEAARKAEEVRKADEARKAAEPAAQQEAARKAEEARKADEARKAAELAAQQEAARKAAEAQAQREAARRAEEARKADEARKAAEAQAQQ